MAQMAVGSQAEDTKNRFNAIRERAQKLGVLDISFSGTGSSDSLECYERTLDIIEANKAVLDHNAGEAEN